MNRFAIAISLPLGAAVLLQANPSHALTVNVNNIDYDVNIFTGSLSQFISSGLNRPWLTSIGDATLFADAYALQDSTVQSVNNPSEGAAADLGPLFYIGSDQFVAWNNGDALPNFDQTPFTSSYLCNINTAFDCTSVNTFWAYANPTPLPPSTVPAPLPLLGATAAFSFSRKLRRRVNAQKFTF
jgi:hypothetical protein